MKYHVLDPVRFSDYLAHGRCPACGCKKHDGEKHMEPMVLNGLNTWGCWLADYNYPDPKQGGMIR
jgi:hypothetical protein